MKNDLEIGKLYRVKCEALSVAKGTPGISIKFCVLYCGDNVMYLGTREELLKFLYGDEFVFCFPNMENKDDERWEKVSE